MCGNEICVMFELFQVFVFFLIFVFHLLFVKTHKFMFTHEHLNVQIKGLRCLCIVEQFTALFLIFQVLWSDCVWFGTTWSSLL